MRTASKMRVSDLPIAVIIATVAVGSGVFLAETTSKLPVPSGRSAVAATAEWFGEFSRLDADFAAARKAGRMRAFVDPVATGAIGAAGTKAKSDRLPPKAEKVAAEKPVPAGTGGRQAALPDASARAVAFGALAPAPWVKIKVTTSPAELAAVRLPPVPQPERTPVFKGGGAPEPLGPIPPALAYSGAPKGDAPFKALFKSGTEEGTVELPRVRPLTRPGEAAPKR